MGKCGGDSQEWPLPWLYSIISGSRQMGAPVPVDSTQLGPRPMYGSQIVSGYNRMGCYGTGHLGYIPARRKELSILPSADPGDPWAYDAGILCKRGPPLKAGLYTGIVVPAWVRQLLSVLHPLYPWLCGAPRGVAPEYLAISEIATVTSGRPTQFLEVHIKPMVHEFRPKDICMIPRIRYNTSIKTFNGQDVSTSIRAYRHLMGSILGSQFERFFFEPLADSLRDIK